MIGSIRERVRSWLAARRLHRAEEEPAREEARRLREELETTKWQAVDRNMPPRDKDRGW